MNSRLEGKGPQLQNIPLFARRVFVPDRGNVYVQGDYRRAEAMYVAFDAGDPELMALFADESRDLYCETATECLGRPITKRDKERSLFKRIVLGSNYGMGDSRLVNVTRKDGLYLQDLDVPGCSSPRSKAHFFLERYHRRYSKIRGSLDKALPGSWHARIEEEVRRTRRLYSSPIDGFRRLHLFLDRLDDHSIKVAYSRRPQASVTGITNRALRLLHNAGERLLCAQVHDSVVIEVPAADRNSAAQRLKAVMTYTLEVYDGRTVTIPIDLQWSDKSWGEMSDDWS